MPNLKLNGDNIGFVNKVKYLGVFITEDFKDDCDMKRQLSAIYCKSNMLLKQFSKCAFDVKKLLFKSFCCNFYCSQLWWSFTKTNENKLRIAFNKGLRKMLGYDRMYSGRAMFVENEMENYDVLKRKITWKFYNRVLQSTNALVVNTVQSCLFLRSLFANMLFNVVF